MHLTSTARTARYRKRQADKIERMEKALEKIAAMPSPCAGASHIAIQALNPTTHPKTPNEAVA